MLEKDECLSDYQITPSNISIFLSHKEESELTLQKREENFVYFEGHDSVISTNFVDIPYGNNYEEGFKGTGLQGYEKEKDKSFDSSDVIYILKKIDLERNQKMNGSVNNVPFEIRQKTKFVKYVLLQNVRYFII